MSLVDRALGLLRGGPKVGGEHAQRLAAWRARPAVDLDLPHARMRYVVVDTETTGLDLDRDNVIAIGAAAVSEGCLGLGDCFETVLRQHRASADDNILIHGIGGQTQLGGVDPASGMLDFLEYVGKCPLVAFRAEFDRPMIDRSMKSSLGAALKLPWIDLAFLLPALFPDSECTMLDDWLVRFGLGGGERHHAVSDAFAAAQLLQIALTEAAHERMGSAAELIAMEKAQRWLGRTS